MDIHKHVCAIVGCIWC